MFPGRHLSRLREILSGFSPGDRLLIDWKSGDKNPTTHPPAGTVVGTTERLIVLHSPEGFRFCVSVNDLASGTTLRRV